MSHDTSTSSISALLKKTEHYDKDERYMATSDLCEVLKRQANETAGTSTTTGGLDANTERQICTAVLRLLHDKSNDVQAIAVKTLGVLLTTVKTEQVLEIADSLADQVLDASKSELRDVYAIGSRTLVKTIPASMGNIVSQRLVGRLLDGIRTGEPEICLACLDILTELLTRFGATALSVTRQHEPILQVCLRSQLSSTSAVVRKRAGTTLGCLSVVLSDALLMRMVESLLSQMDLQTSAGGGASAGSSATASTGDTRSLIRTMCTVSGAVGHRLGQEQIDRILPIFLRFTQPEDAVTGDDERMEDAVDPHANELKESCFMGFESFVLRCPKQVEPHLQRIIQAALAYMSFDPNYSYGDEDDGNDDVDAVNQDPDDDDDDEMLQNEDEDEYEDDDDDDEEDDDDDESWKVRRSAIRALRAVVEAKKHDPSTLWKTPFAVRHGKSTLVSMALVERFKEREENCRVDVMDCFTRLLSVTIAAAHAGVVQLTSSPDDMETASTSIDLRPYAVRLVKACQKIFSVKKGNERSKSSALALLSVLCQAPGGVGGQAEISAVFKHVKSFLGTCQGTADLSLQREGTSKALRLDALSLIHAMLVSDKHELVHVRRSLRQYLLPELCDAVKEQWYKVIAEALRALAAVPRFFVDSEDSERAEVALMLYTAIEPLLAAHDVDQEIKECALNACGQLLSLLHSTLPTDKKERLLKLLLERLKNETTRIMAIKTLVIIASAKGNENGNVVKDTTLVSQQIDLSPILAESIATMASFLKLQSRSLKQNSLEALNVVVRNHGAANEFASGEHFSSLLQEASSLIVDDDLHITHLSLRVAVSVLQVCPNAGPAVKAHLLDRALSLSTSVLVQDATLDSLLAFFKQTIISNAVEFNDLLFLFRKRLNEKIGKTGVYNLAKCIAVITATTSTENGQKVLTDVFNLLEKKDASIPADTLREVQLSLLLTGDLGRMYDLSKLDGVSERLKSLYITYFDSSSDELRQAASYALGNASVGSPETFLPVIVRNLDENNKKQQYLLLSALREFIQSSFRESGGEGVAASLPVIIPPLEKHCSDAEEGVRTMVAECLGSLTCLQPDALLPMLANLQTAHSSIVVKEDGTVADDDLDSKKNAHVCWTVASSLKLSFVGKVESSQLSIYMPTFVKLLEIKELNVRTAALLMVFSAVHHRPQAIASLLKDSVMPLIYEVAELKLERKVDLGPFTHKVDDALPLRKAALSIFATCLDNFPGSMDIPSFMPVLAKFLNDAEDIQLHCHQIIIWMCARQPTYLVTSIDTLVEPLEKTINKKSGQKTGTELERLNDWIKSALRAVAALSKLEGAMNSRVFVDFIGRIKNNSKFSGMLESLGEEN